MAIIFVRELEISRLSHHENFAILLAIAIQKSFFFIFQRLLYDLAPLYCWLSLAIRLLESHSKMMLFCMHFYDRFTMAFHKEV